MHGDGDVFGERAALWAAGLPPDLDAIVADEGHFGAALRAAGDARLAGRTFFGAPLLADRRLAYVRRRALALFGNGTLEAQIAALDRVAAESAQPDVTARSPELNQATERRVLREFILAADALLLRSLGELRRLRDLFGDLSFQRVAIAGGPAAGIPAAPARATRDLIVLWAPHLAASELGLEIAALMLSQRPAAVVCAGGSLAGTNLIFATSAQSAELTARARLVVLADEYDGGAAVTFAARGCAVTVPLTNGALEELDGLRAFDPIAIASLRAALDAGWNDAPAVPRATVERPATVLSVPADARASTAVQLGRTAWNIAPAYDFRRDAFDRITAACAPLAPAAPMDRQLVAHAVTSRTRLQLGSFREVEYVQRSLGFVLPDVAVGAPPDARVPAQVDPAPLRDAIVVWAPDAPLDALTVILMGLHYEKRPVLVVCAHANLTANITVVPPAEAAAALARAHVIVDADAQSPAAAIALARFGIPLAVASTSGADEYLDRIGVYDPWDHLSVSAAVGVSKYTLGPLVPRRIEIAALPARLAAYGDEIATEGSLVSIVVLTRNRRGFLRKALESIAVQRYRAIEIVVVNNGGVAVDDIVADFPNARLIDSAENLGAVAGANLGTREARGTFLAFLADDDAFFAEHVGACVGALERTGADFAHAGMLAVDLTAGIDDAYAANGYAFVCERPAEPGALYGMNAVAGPTIFVRREPFAASGNWSDLGIMGDYEAALRFMILGELIYVNRPTAIQTYRRNDATQYSSSRISETLATLEQLYATHPVHDMPWVEKTRAGWLARFAQHQASGATTPLWFPTPAITFPPVPYAAADGLLASQ